MRRTGTVPLRVTLCRGCCCGTVKKRSDVDHEAQRVRLHALAATGAIACRETDCLGPCDSANVMVVSPRPNASRAGARPTWFGEVSDDQLDLVIGWITDGGPGVVPLPTGLERHVVPPGAA